VWGCVVQGPQGSSPTWVLWNRPREPRTRADRGTPGYRGRAGPGSHRMEAEDRRERDGHAEPTEEELSVVRSLTRTSGPNSVRFGCSRGHGRTRHQEAHGDRCLRPRRSSHPPSASTAVPCPKSVPTTWPLT